MAVNNVFKVAIVGSYAGQEMVLTSHYRQSTANTSVETDHASLLAAVRLTVVPALVLAVVSDMTLVRAESRLFIPPGGPLTGEDVDIAADGPGALAPPGMPPTVAVVLQRKTALLGRKYRGRQYLPATPVAEQVDHLVASAFAAGALLDYANSLKASLIHTGVSGAPTFIPVVAAFDPLVIVPTPGVRWTDVTRVAVDRIYRSQRRRQQGVGA